MSRQERRFWQHWLATSAVVLATVALNATAVSVSAADADAAGVEFFETRIRPLLVEHCFKCHGPIKQFAELRLDSRKAMLEGGDTGPAVVPGDLKKSLIIDAVRYGDVQMPPDGKLKDQEIAAFEKWILMGAPFPEKPPQKQASADQHWAYQPVKAVAPPKVSTPDWIRTPVDQFVLAKLESNGLKPAPAATRRTLIRRLTYDLTGLPPTPEEVQAFEESTDPSAYEKLVEQLLASPHYGEHWGRHWLDVARYSDTKGYVYAREEKVFVHAPTYRDWVVRSLNDDLPYDRFVQLQLAADAMDSAEKSDLAALGFLTLGRRFLGVTPDIVDDKIDVVTRGMLGLTVACARCHDHKYDPIPTADYYSLYGVFQNCTERLVQLGPESQDAAFTAELERRQREQRETFARVRGELSDRVRGRITDYLVAQTELQKYHAENFDIVIEKNDLIPLVVRRWESFLAQPDRATDPIFGPWTRFAALKAEDFAKQAADVVSAIEGPDGAGLLPEVRALFATPPASMREVAERYGKLLSDFDRQWTALPADNVPEFWNAFRHRLAQSQSSPLVRLLYAPDSPCALPAEHISTIERMMDNANCNLLWKLQGDVDRWIIQSPAAPAFATILSDKDSLTEQRIFRRGNPSLMGDVVPRRFLKLLSDGSRTPFTHGSGRLDLAQAITDPANPLTARVWVNRVWANHFGAGLVRTPSDFGVRAEPPSHPELLDWLAERFVREGWSTKKLHRLIVLSNTYQQQSSPDESAITSKARLLDPQNRLLWRMNPHRLSFEELRDTWLAVTGDLESKLGGRSTDLFAANPPHRRRTLYGYIDRQFVPDVLRMFDVANPDLHSPQRSETTVPQQALFALNHPVAASCSKTLAGKLTSDPQQFVESAFQRIVQRSPTAAQLEQCVAYLQQPVQEPEPTPVIGAGDWQYGYGEVDAEKQRVTSFTPLPHFTGQARQGGPNWPDKKLGWVQITADGGHAGNDLQHAAIRRWVAPEAMTVSVKSLVQHEVAAGDGIRSWIISSRGGTLKSQVVHNTMAEFNVDSLEVQPGDTLDFVVDYNANLNSDQYLWAPVVRKLASTTTENRVWDAQQQFDARPVTPLTPREQLVQVLLLSNELMFVD
jgi:cytochrome c553